MATPVATGQDEYVVDNPRLRAFIEEVSCIRHQHDSPVDIIAAIRPHFAELLADETWLPEKYQVPVEEGGMGSGIGNWLLYRAGDGSLALSALVVPPGAQTPVHDHLAWGLVGLYRGTQDEDVFTRDDDGSSEKEAVLSLLESRSLQTGDFYELLPETDIHRVRTTSDITSVSLHLLGIDNGCIWRHRFVPEEGKVLPFKSGYVNAPCEDAG
ncbi:MAG: cysteine dioxygenase family protein [Thermomicrobiales bacterium]|nr:cysteine dioxygenase family protein [Thermomicrobiales bacterium]